MKVEWWVWPIIILLWGYLTFNVVVIGCWPIPAGGCWGWDAAVVDAGRVVWWLGNR